MPGTCMTGHMADISNICDYSLNEWVMFCDQPITCPDFPVILGCYLGLSIDVRTAMSYRILKENGEYVCRTTARLLNRTERDLSEHNQLRNNFDAYMAEAFGSAATITDLYYKKYTDLTPHLDYYNNFDEDSAKGSPDDYPSVLSTSEVNDQSFNVDLMIPYGSS